MVPISVGAGQEEGQGSVNVIVARRQVMAELVGQQDREQRRARTEVRRADRTIVPHLDVSVESEIVRATLGRSFAPDRPQQRWWSAAWPATAMHAAIALPGTVARGDLPKLAFPQRSRRIRIAVR